MIADIDERLRRWAEWSRMRRYGVGWPGQTLEYRMARDGQVIQSSVTEPENPDEEEIDRLIASLPRELRYLKRALKARYLWTHSNRAAADTLGVSVATLKHWIDQAHCWLAGRLQSG